MKKLLYICLCLWIGIPCALAQQEITQELQQKYTQYTALSDKIWQWAEPGYLEDKTSNALIEELQAAGFQIQKGVGAMQTAFVATYGTGSPVIGILAEMDALPGLSQEAVPFRKAKFVNAYGHACGHNLFGVGSVAAAIATKNWMAKAHIKGTIRLIGTPAEEGAGGGKTYLVKEGVFKDIDAVLHWHPGDNNNASPNSSLAYRVANFSFSGLAAHASASPEKGRSALDAVEAMNYMVNLMREHISPETRIHYVIKNGGLTSNIVPDYAMVEYTIRNPTAQGLEEIWQRLLKTAEAAAHGTETKMSYEILAGLYNLLPNDVLAKEMQKSLEKVGGVPYTPEEIAFAEKIRQTVNAQTLAPISSAQTVRPYTTDLAFPASTDVGDVSWVTPTAGLSTATWVPGVPAHSWQAVACNGMSIGHKGMMNAAQTIALTAQNLFNSPNLIEQAKKELYQRRGTKIFEYKSLAGDRKPPLDYRK
ncbi:amidohydrolase [Emticicia sp. ODNR4P]|nr:amidohydrolase [Emticicia sp. ODNR4P]